MSLDDFNTGFFFYTLLLFEEPLLSSFSHSLGILSADISVASCAKLLGVQVWHYTCTHTQTHTLFFPIQANRFQHTLVTHHYTFLSSSALLLSILSVRETVCVCVIEHALSRYANLTHTLQTHTPAAYSSPSDTADAFKNRKAPIHG